MDNNSLQQYIDLYEQNVAAVDAGSAPVLNRLRPAALETLRHSHLPTTRTEGYEKTSLNDMFAPDYGVNINRMDMTVDAAESFRCGVPNLSTRLAIVANDIFRINERLSERLPEGVTFCSLRRAALDHPEQISRYYATVAPADDPAVALNTLLVQDGVFIHIGRGVHPEKPLQLVNILNASFPMLAFRRVLIVAEPDSSLQLLVCDHTSPASGNNPFLTSCVTEIIAEQGSHIDLCDIEEATPATSRLSQTYVRQHEGSRLTFSSMALDGGTTRNEFTINLCGEHAESHLAGMAIATDQRRIDNCSSVNHIAPRCSSRQLFKYVLDDKAIGAFEGGIRVNEGAVFTEAYQSNRNVLASTDASMHSSPHLEIYNDDVKCSHGATTGQLDSEALFYMQTRGIPLQEARKMLMQAFMTDVIDAVSIQGLRERLVQLVDRRFNREHARCADCNHLTHPLIPRES